MRQQELLKSYVCKEEAFCFVKRRFSKKVSAEHSSPSFDICPLLATNASVQSTEKDQKNYTPKMFMILFK